METTTRKKTDLQLMYRSILFLCSYTYHEHTKPNIHWFIPRVCMSWC